MPIAASPPPRAPGSLAVLAALLASSAASHAQDVPTIADVAAGFPILQRPAGAARATAAPVAAPRVRLGSWAPVRVLLRNGPNPFHGQLEVACPDDDDLPLIVRAPVALPPGGESAATVMVRPGSSRPSLGLRFLDADGRPLGRPTTVPLTTPLEPARRVILAAGQAPGLPDLAGLFKFQDAGAGVSVGTLDHLPPQWFGLDGAEVVVLVAADPAAATLLRPESVAVLRDWVAQGGHLVVSLGANWKDTADALDDLLPARPTGTLVLSELSELGALESFAGTVSRPIPPPLNVIRLEASGPGAVPLAAVAATPLVVRGGYGFGRVTVLGLDVSRPPFADWPDRTLVWDRLVDLRGRAAESTGVVAGGRGSIIQQADPDLAARLHQALGAFPGVRLVPFGLVASLVFLYLIAVGPLDYFFLRRVLRRMEWTWVTFPLLVVGTSAAAFAAAHALKGDRLRVNAIDLLDVDQSRGALRGATWLTTFSPGNLDYRAAVAPIAPDLNPASPPPPWLSTTLSWFGPPDASLSGVGRWALGDRRATYENPGRYDQLTGLRIPIWSTKSLAGRWAGSAPGTRVLDADLRTVAGDRVTGSVRNRLDHTLLNARLFYGRNAYDLGTIRPRGIARVDPTRSEAASRHLARLVQSADRRGPQTAEPDALRVELLRAALFRDALGSRADAYPSAPLRGLDMSAHANELRRPILVAEVDAPASQITLDGHNGDPQWTRSTVVRVVLDLDAPDASSSSSN
jgi:hypothetical protein